MVSAVTSEVREKEAISNKKLTINFPVNGNTLDNDARALIDREFVPIAKQFNNARVILTIREIAHIMRLFHLEGLKL